MRTQGMRRVRRLLLAGPLLVAVWHVPSSAQVPQMPTPNVSGSIQTVGNISLPSMIDGMTATQTSNPEQKEFAEAFVFQNGADRITVKVFQANFPNVGIWHEAHKAQSLELFRPLNVTPFGQVSEISVQSSQPNGLIEAFHVGSPFVSTSIATIGFDRWIVAIHSTSKTLTVDQQVARISRFTQAIKPEQRAAQLYSIRAPVACGPDEKFVHEKEGTLPTPVEPSSAALFGGFQLAVSKRDAIGKTAGGGLSMNPDQFCKATSTSGRTFWYQTRSSIGLPKWIQLVSVTGLAVEGFAILDDKDASGAAMFGGIITHGYRTSNIVAYHNALPNPISGQLEGLMPLVKEIGSK